MLMNQKFDLVVMNPKEIKIFVARVNFANVIPKKYMGEKMWCISSASAVLQSILNIPIQRFSTFFLFLSFLVFTCKLLLHQHSSISSLKTVIES